METKTWNSQSLEDLPTIANDVIQSFPSQRVVLFVGKMGAGKTTFIKSLCRVLGSEDDISSPTFSLVNEYQSLDTSIYHFDFYRIEQESEAFDMGFEEYLESGKYCLIEWPDRVEGLLPDEFLLINITEQEGRREIQVRAVK